MDRITACDLAIRDVMLESRRACLVGLSLSASSSRTLLRVESGMTAGVISSTSWSSCGTVLRLDVLGVGGSACSLVEAGTVAEAAMVGAVRPYPRKIPEKPNLRGFEALAISDGKSVQYSWVLRLLFACVVCFE